MSTTEVEAQVTEAVTALHDVSWNEAIRALLVLAIGWVVIQIVLRLARRASARLPKANKALGDFLIQALRILLYFMLLTTALAQLGVPVTSMVAVISLLALAISLSVQNLLTDVVSGITVLASHPFAVGDWIETPAVSGTVDTIGLLYTQLIMADNRLILVPNSQIAGTQITNYSARPTRRIDLTLRLGYEYDGPQVIAALKRAAARLREGHDAGVEPFAAVNGYKDSGVEYVLRLTVPTKDYWDVYHSLLLAVREELLADGIEMTYAATRIIGSVDKPGTAGYNDPGLYP